MSLSRAFKQAKSLLRSSMLRQIGLYTVPNLLARGMGFILLPLYTKYLAIEEFGQMALLGVLASFLNYFFHFGWGSAYARYYREKAVDTGDLNRTMLVFRFVVAGFILVGVLWPESARSLAALLVDDTGLAVGLTAVVVKYVLEEGVQFYTTRYRMMDRAGLFALVNIAQSILSFGLIYYLFVIKQGGINSIFVAQAIAVGTVLFGLSVLDNRWIRTGHFKKAILVRALKFGIPLVPAAVALFLLTGSDRYMMKWLLTGDNYLAQIGIYALGFRLVAFMQLFTVGFNRFWAPFVFKSYTEDDARENYCIIFRSYTTVLSLAAFALCAALPILVNWLFPKYDSALPLVPVMLCGFLIYNIGDYFSIGIGISEKTKIRAYAGTATAGLNLLLNYFMIPAFGSMGAAWATSLSYMFYTGLLMGFSHRLYKVDYALSTWIFPVLAIPVTVVFMSHYPEWTAMYYVVCMTLQLVLFFRAGGIARIKTIKAS